MARRAGAVKFGPVPLAEAEGAILAHGLVIDGRRLAKGRVLDAADIDLLRRAGHEHVVAARLEDGDVGEDGAASALAAALAGSGLVALPAVHGRVNLAARADGLLLIPPGLVRAVNGCDEAITLATLPAYARVTAGSIVATIKIIRYAVDQATLDAAIAAVAAPLRLAAFQPRRVALVASRLPGTSAKALAKLEQVTRARISTLGGTLVVLPPVPHTEAALSAAISDGLGMADLVLVAGASATVDRGDIVPGAITQLGGTVSRLGMPVDPGNLLVLGAVAAKPVIGLPGCAKSPKRNGLDLVLERLLAGLAVTSDDIAAMGEGGLLPEAERPEPRAAATRPGKVGAVLLAAGRSSRFGDDHKLLAEWRGLPLVAQAVDAIAAAGLPPPIIVLGHQAEAVQAALAGRTATFVAAPDWADGMGRSLAAGIAAVPGDWEAALVCLADMPAVEPALIAALARAPGEVVVPIWDGRRGHPVRWPRAAFARLLALEGDMGGKTIMADFSVTEIEAPSAACLLDIDTPAALANLPSP
jgi:molybdenum cofactor cytidylyltransferase